MAARCRTCGARHFAMPESALDSNGATVATCHDCHRHRAEIEARQAQQKIRRLNGNTGHAGPLFDTQYKLF